MSINPHAPWAFGNLGEFDPGKMNLPAHWVDTKEARTEFCKYPTELRQLDDQVGDVMVKYIANVASKEAFRV